jgi:hypothetical protein
MRRPIFIPAKTGIHQPPGITRDCRGVAAVEFAVVALGFLFLLLGAIEVGLLLWTTNALRITAEMTARCDALGSCSNPGSYAVALAGQWMGANAVKTSDVTVSPEAGSRCHGASGGYGSFTMVTISSELWSSLLIAPLAGTQVKVSACYPSPS